MTIVALVSGGVDSFIMHKYLMENSKNEDIIPLFVYYNGRYNDKEYEAVHRLFSGAVITDRTLNLGDKEFGDKAFIQNRNAYFALVASHYGDKIAMGGLKDDNVGDKTPFAFLKMTELLNTINSPKVFSVFSPFWNKEKIDALEWYLNRGYDRDILQDTLSCYSDDPDIRFCGECPACFRKYCAFKWFGIPIGEFTNLGLVTTYFEEWKNKKGKRAESIRFVAKELLK